MTDDFKIKVLDCVLDNLPNIIVALGGFVVVIRKIRDVHTLVNSQVTALLEATRSAAHLAGILAERARAKTESEEKKKPE